MQNIIKSEAPDYFQAIEKDKKIKNWNDLDRILNQKIKISLKEELRTYMLENEQKNRCVYCETKIVSSNKKSHIEHIEPKNKVSNKFKDYKNLVVSCNNKNTCGVYKENSYSEKFINPVLENPNKYLTYDRMTGEVIPRKVGLIETKKAKYTIKVLNLNFSKLKDARAVFILGAKNMKDCLEYLDEFPSLLEELKEKNNVI